MNFTFSRYIFFFVFLLHYSSLLGQNKFNDLNQNGHLIIKVKEIVTQEFAVINDSIAVKNQMPGFPLPPPTAVLNRSWDINFIVSPNSYLQYRVLNEVIDSIPASRIGDIIRINRADLKGQVFSPLLFSKFKEERNFSTSRSEFQLVKKDLKKTRMIGGYNCFWVLYRSVRFPNILYEMYVTPDIKLNYNPVLKNPDFLNDYYPLYIKRFDETYPKDNFKEYTFLRRF